MSSKCENFSRNCLWDTFTHVTICVGQSINRNKERVTSPDEMKQNENKNCCLGGCVISSYTNTKYSSLKVSSLPNASIF